MPFELEALFLRWTLPFYAIVILGEILYSHFAHKSYYTWRDTIHNILLSSINSLIDVSFRVVYLYVYILCYQYRFITWENPYLYWLLLFFLQDFCFYFLHYTEHISRFFWAVHATHHSSEQYNLTTGFRSSVFEPLYRFVFFFPLCFLGFRGEDIILMYAITQFYGGLIHTQYAGRLGILEYFLVTPSHHRVHHASNVPYLDKNMGMVLIIWDRMFGTFQPENAPEPTRFGLVHNIPKNNFLYVLFHEWINIAKTATRKGLTLKERFLYIFGKPGWSHDGTGKTSEDLQRDWEREHPQKK